MSFSLSEWLFPSAEARTIGSVDLSQPGGIVQIPVGPNYPYSGNLGNTPADVTGAGLTPYPDGRYVPPQGVSGEQPGDFQTIRPNPPVGATPSTYTGNGWSYSHLPEGRGWFYNSEAGAFQFNNGDGTVSASNGGPVITPGQPTTQSDPNAVNPGSVMNPVIRDSTKALTWIEELAIRAMMILVGTVLLGAGFYTAGLRAQRAKTVVQLVRSGL